MSTFNSRLVPWSTSEHRCGNIIELYICMWCKNIGWACQRRICYHFPNIFSWDEYNICFEKCLIDICRFSLIKKPRARFCNSEKYSSCIFHLFFKWDSKNYPTILDASVVKYDTGLVQKARLVYNYLYVRRSLILCHMFFLYACETHVNLRLLNSGKLYRWTYFTIYLQSFLLNKNQLQVYRMKDRKRKCKHSPFSSYCGKFCYLS